MTHPPGWKSRLCIVLVLAGVAGAAEYTIDTAESLFAVVVHKGGIAARFAHNHLVVAQAYAAKLSIAGTDPATIRFDVDIEAAQLQVDAPEAHTKWYPEIAEAGILDEPFKPLDDADRKTIAEHMLAKGQLDVKQFPRISAKVVEVREERGTYLEREYTHVVTLDFTVHGTSVQRECPARIVIEDGRVKVDAVGAFTFSGFGIKPYSAMAGAVKNRDEFHVFVRVRALAEGTGAQDE